MRPKLRTISWDSHQIRSRKRDQVTVAKLLRSSEEVTVGVVRLFPRHLLGSRCTYVNLSLHWDGDHPVSGKRTSIFDATWGLPQRVFPPGNSPPYKWPQCMQNYVWFVGGLPVVPGSEICFQRRKKKNTNKAKPTGTPAVSALNVILHWADAVAVCKELIMAI